MIAQTQQKHVEAVGPKVLGRFLDKMGGAEAFGDTIYEDFARTRQKAIEAKGENQVIEKRLDAFRKDILTKLVDIDRFHHETGEFDDVSDEDLVGLLMEQAEGKLTENPLFAVKMLKLIRDNQPGIFQQLLATGEIPSAPQVIDVTLDEVPDELLALCGPEDDDLPDNLFAEDGSDDADAVAAGAEEFTWPA